jgi:hypothetical protein
MEPWFAPLQVITSLGITIPLFIYYAWRFYSLILEHRHAVFELKDSTWIDAMLGDGWNLNDISAQLSLTNVYLEFDKKLGSIRRSLRADVYIIILIGFIGTLIGMIGSFTSLLTAVGDKGLDPSVAIATLIKGGLSTALVSSLFAAIMAAVVMGYLSLTERTLVDLKKNLNVDCLNRYRESHLLAEGVNHVVA